MPKKVIKKTESARKIPKKGKVPEKVPKKGKVPEKVPKKRGKVPEKDPLILLLFIPDMLLNLNSNLGYVPRKVPEKVPKKYLKKYLKMYLKHPKMYLKSQQLSNLPSQDHLSKRNHLNIRFQSHG